MTDTLRDRLGAAIDMAFYEAEQHVPAKDGHCDKCSFCHCSVGHVLAMAQEGVHNVLAAQPAPAVMGEEPANHTALAAQMAKELGKNWTFQQGGYCLDGHLVIPIPPPPPTEADIKRGLELEKELLGRTAAAETLQSNKKENK